MMMAKGGPSLREYNVMFNDARRARSVEGDGRIFIIIIIIIIIIHEAVLFNVLRRQ